MSNDKSMSVLKYCPSKLSINDNKINLIKPNGVQPVSSIKINEEM